MSRKVHIITIIIILIILVGWYFYNVSLYYIVFTAIIYLAANIVGSANIKLNYFFYSHCSSRTTKKEIAITFDDGPHPKITPKLINLLDSYNASATFFCIGKNVLSYSDIVTSIFNSGHIIGNHSYNHGRFFDLLPSSGMIKEIINTNNVIKSVTGKSPLLFRPPYGVTNPMLCKAIRKTNMSSVGWSLRSFDTVKSSRNVLKKLIRNTKPGDIILFHDTNPNIITIIEDYLSWLQENDYKIISLASLLNITAYED